MKFNFSVFKKFCEALTVESKEDGKILLGKQLLGSQRHVMREIGKGLENGIHFFVIQKARQLGITTITLALDLYWHYIHSGMQGTIVTDSEENRDMVRSTLEMYQNGLPVEYKIPVSSHNRNQMVFKNRSRLFYQVAGKRSNGGLGRGKGITFLHGTETSSWGDEEGLLSLIASLAEKNERRLFVFESTARGFNHWHEMFTEAERSLTQKAIFAAWWMNDKYSTERDSMVFKTYWDNKMTPFEKEWVKEVNKKYNAEITPEQLAWYRWKQIELFNDNESIMMQEYPSTPEQGFIMSGASFFSSLSCTESYKSAQKKASEHYRITFGLKFEDMELMKSTERLSNFILWEEPLPNAYYVIGADPAYGSSEWADSFCIQVYRCYADGLEQVAEFATPDINTMKFAWVVAYLAGAFPNSTLNLEVNGPGQAVLNEIHNLKQIAMAKSSFEGNHSMLAIMQHRNYIWRRMDSMGALSNSIGWVTSQGSKERMMSIYRDQFERGSMTVNSLPLLEEMKTIVREDGWIGASGRNKDDRVIASALAVAAWADQVRPQLVQRGELRKVNKQRDDEMPDEVVMNSTIRSYLNRVTG